MKRFRLQIFTLPFISVLFAITSCGDESTTNTIENQSDTLAIPSETETNMPIAIDFLSLDSLLISAVLWEIDPDSQTILLCHQAGSNYHEYDEIAPKLNDLGYNCLAIDQRAGGILFDVVNQTADRAISEGRVVGYTAAEQDILAAISFCYERYQQPVFLWGSSYSAGLALHISQENEAVSAVIAFSPGDYFEDEKPALKERMKAFTKPYFITSSKQEAEKISEFLVTSKSDSIHIHYVPSENGIHGSKALWESTPNHTAYWDALKQFLTHLDG